MRKFDITIIVPTFKAESTIADCLTSILGQSDVSVEIIVVDGASPDATVSIAKSFASSNLVIISERDKGIYDAINKGVLHARGALIGVLGADDIYLPGTLSTVKQSFSGGAEIVSGLTLIDGVLRADEVYGPATLISGIPFGHNAMFASRDAYQAVGLYDLSYRICADAEWVHRAIKLSIPCRKIEKVFVKFGTEGTSSTNPDEIMEEAYRVIQSNFPFLSREEAKILLYSKRNWGFRGESYEIYNKRMNKSSLFIDCLAEAFPEFNIEKPKSIKNSIAEKYRRLMDFSKRI